MSRSERKPRGPRKAPRAAGAGVWDISVWCGAFGIGLSTFYTLEPKPLSVRVGRLIKIIEAPEQYAHRLAASQGATETTISSGPQK